MAFIDNLVHSLTSVAILIGAAAIIWLRFWVDALIKRLIAGYV